MCQRVYHVGWDQHMGKVTGYRMLQGVHSRDCCFQSLSEPLVHGSGTRMPLDKPLFFFSDSFRRSGQHSDSGPSALLQLFKDLEETSTRMLEPGLLYLPRALHTHYNPRLTCINASSPAMHRSSPGWGTRTCTWSRLIFCPYPGHFVSQLAW